MYAVCAGGEGADLKSVELKGFAGSNPVCSAFKQNWFTIMEFL